MILSGIGLDPASDDFTFIVVYKGKIEDDAKESDNFGLVKVSIQDLIKRLKSKDIAAYYVNKRIPDKEIETIVSFAWFSQNAFIRNLKF